MPEQCVALSSQRPLLMIGFGAKAQHAGNVAEDLNNKAEPTTGKQSVFAPNTPLGSPIILRFAFYPSRSSPRGSAEGTP